MEKPWAASSQKLISSYRTDSHHGLSTAEARRRLTQVGANELPRQDQPSRGAILLRQFTSPLMVVLVIAALLALYQAALIETLVIAAVILTNGVIGYLQEYRAEKTMSKLHQIFAPQARVIRDSTEQKIPARLLVPGDILLLEAGDRVGADARVIESQSLRLNQASLTGESVPAMKDSGLRSSQTPLINRGNMAYLSTLVVSGQGVAVVTATGLKTEFGQIAHQIKQLKETEPILKQRIDRLAATLLWSSIALAGLVLLIGLFYQVELVTLLKLTLSLLVSLVPEGLPVVLTVILSVALVDIFRQEAVIRRLAAAETLGEATVVAVDKTGTLTEGTMVIERLYVAGKEYRVDGERYRLSGHFYANNEKIDVTKEPAARLFLELASLSTMSTISRADLARDETRALTDPTETALAVVAAKAGFYAFKQEKLYPELLEVPFDQKTLLSSSIHQFGRQRRRITKGAVEKVLGLSTRILGANGQVARLTAAQKAKLEDIADHYASLGYRISALAFSDLAPKESLSIAVSDLTFAGLFCLTDPIRPDARAAIKDAKAAGLQVVMITGDHLLTAESVARKVGLLDDGIAIHADNLSTADIGQVRVIARATPRDKLLFVERLQKNGQIVAMTGDGVNDAPALKKADIGVALGKSGTDVAIETADMVLLKDRFSSITFAVTRGRLVYENLRKAIFYLVSTSLGEAAVIVTALILRLPLPLLAVQILWMNLVTDGITSMALAFERPEKPTAKKPVNGALLQISDLRRMVLLSLTMAIGTLLLYQAALPQGEALARTVALTTMVFFQLWNLLNSRSASHSIFRPAFFTNPILFTLLASAVVAQLFVIYWPLAHYALHTVALSTPLLLSIVAVTSTIVVVDELRKLTLASFRRWALQLQQAEH